MGDEGDRKAGGADVQRPVFLALAAAILICALPLAYRIVGCDGFEAGLSLQQLFSFKCQPAAGGKASAKPVVETGADAPSREALAAATLDDPEGYASYRVEGGVARPSASLSPANGRRAPAFADAGPGLVLVATQRKNLRRRPFGASVGTLRESGTCFEVIDGDRVADEPATSNRSGGWLPVRALDACPAKPGPTAAPGAP